MKYIDADKLKRFVGELKERAKRNRCDSWGIVPDALEEVEGFIDSLQQDKETLMLEMCNQSFWEDSGYIMIPPDVTIEGIESLLKQVKKKLQQEQPEVDLDAIVDEAFDKYSSVDGYGQLSVSFNRAELYSFIKKIARKEE